MSDAHGNEAADHGTKAHSPNNAESHELSDLEKMLAKAAYGVPGYAVAAGVKSYIAYALGASMPIVAGVAAASIGLKYVLDNYFVNTAGGGHVYRGLMQTIKESPKTIGNFFKSTISALENLVTFPGKFMPAYAGAHGSTTHGGDHEKPHGAHH